jgi:hypothetical protein
VTSGSQTPDFIQEEDVPHAWAYDMHAPARGLRDLGTLGGRWDTTRVSAIDHGVLVGSAERPDGSIHPFAYDTNDDHPRIVDLGVLPHATYGTARDVDHRRVVGYSYTAGNGESHAFLWTLRRTRKPVVRFDCVRYSASERSRRARVTVTRDGSLAKRLSVKYAATALDPGQQLDGVAASLQDFTPVRGGLNFTRGQRRASFTVRVTNDARAEPAELILLRLRNTSRGRLGTPNLATLAVRPSDHWPESRHAP